MSSYLATVGLAITVFISTNVDDIFVISAFLANPRMRRRSVVIGQFFGIGALVCVSMFGATLALVIPEGWVSLLGFVPLTLGIRQLLTLRRSSNGVASSIEERDAQPQEAVTEQSSRAQVCSVAGVTIANGGDNVGAYVPLFVVAGGLISIYVIVFAIMTAVWCALGVAIVNNPVLGDPLKRYGHIVLPLVLIVLGLYILSGAALLYGTGLDG